MSGISSRLAIWNEFARFVSTSAPVFAVGLMLSGGCIWQKHGPRSPVAVLSVPRFFPVSKRHRSVSFQISLLRHLGLWQEGGCVHSGTDPPGETTLDPWLDDPFPDYDTEPVVAFSAT
jgi:hypothetical protein